ncbi:translation factor Sua5 [Croceivirga lutea]|uniref:L-threonylcarbamoyladenylate synthase n=1 Tax=Croceivirga lutea TaxID=1775167 RepID=UPI001639531E|nr:Sua5/YciO/YrdC/YwlC family protein [Croceivirga lutea]GGG49584.1 translation factor Sua5 [Croceivirga lutea]
MTSEINNAIEHLKAEGILLLPTETGWVIGCDATNSKAVEKLYNLKQSSNSELLTCLVANQAMLERFVALVPEVAYDILDFATKPTTIVLDKPIGVAPNVIGTQNALALRVTNDKFCQYLINKFRKPIVYSSANAIKTNIPKSFEDITPAILKGVDYVVNLPMQKQNSTLTSIIKLSTNGVVKVIRE